jgi:hypothetical protein
MVSLRESFEFEVSSVKQEGPGAARLPRRVAPRNDMLRIGVLDRGPGWRTPQAKCAKRTQFRPGRGPLPGKIVRNEPNLAWPEADIRGGMRKTNPIWLGRAADAQNKAKLGGTGVCG